MPRFSFKNGRFFKDRKPFFLVASEYQYYRSAKASWRKHLELLRRARVNAITFYVPWRHHLAKKGSYDFDGKTKDNRDLSGFLELLLELGFVFIAKPGPFVHSELNAGGLPDSASPTFEKRIEPLRDWRGRPRRWAYDGSLLPSPGDPLYDAMARDWLKAVGKVLKPHARGPKAGLIAVQVNDEALYCTSSSPPWAIGYDGPALRLFVRLLRKRYRTVSAYNRLHGTAFKDFAQVPPPQPNEPIKSKNDLLRLVDWGEYQWRLRRESLERYQSWLGLAVPALTNLSPIAPSIVENIPEGRKDRGPETLPGYERLYSDWWLSINRVDADRELCRYGFISWLGVAAYDIEDPASTELPPESEAHEVFERFVLTASRARGVNMEENWGFATLYHPFSKHAIVPFFQTLASAAGGATGYVVYCGVQHDCWDDDLDRVTRKQSPTFPSDAPITPDGKTTPLYDAMSLLNEWFAREGEGLLAAEPVAPTAWLVYPPYASVSGWIPEAKVAGLPVPRSGTDGLEPFSAALQRAGHAHRVVELDAAGLPELRGHKALALRLGFFMDRGSQNKLLAYVRGGGTLIACGEPPVLDLGVGPCRLLADQIRGTANRLGKGLLYHERENLFAAGGILRVLERLGIAPAVRAGKGVRAFVHRRGDDFYVFFFHFPRRRGETFVEFPGGRLDLVLGPKSCGVAHVRGARLESVLVKGKNEVEGVDPEIEVRFGRQAVHERGDVLRFL